MSKGLILVIFTTLLIISISACQSLHIYSKNKVKLPVPEGAYYVGSDSCIPCHDDIWTQFRKSVHSRIAGFEIKGQARGCEACHGPGSKHVKSGGGTDNIISFDNMSAEVSSEVCLTCHDQDPENNFRDSSHSMNEISCVDCHKAHKSSNKNMVYLGDPQICYQCHQGKKARSLMPSHHPVREKKMTCCDCHNPHGANPNNLNKRLVNDVCFECHAEYQGPFIYEHEPVFEDCSICHDPHGTIADNLLRQNEPFICLRCHRGHRTNQGTGPHPSAESFLTSCTQCHSQIHGSDLPSQVNDNGLTR